MLNVYNSTSNSSLCIVLSCSLDAWEVPASGTVRLATLLASWREQEATPGPRLSTCTQRRAESILTDFQFWQTVAVQKRPKPRAAVIFWARQLIVQCGLYCNTGKLVLYLWNSAAPQLAGGRLEVNVSGWIRLGEMTVPLVASSEFQLHFPQYDVYMRGRRLYE